MNALFGAMRAAWKSIECGIAPLFVSVILTSLALANVDHRAGRSARPCPGGVLDSGGDLERDVLESTRFTSATGPAGAARQLCREGLVGGGQVVRVGRGRAGVARQAEARVWEWS